MTDFHVEEHDHIKHLKARAKRSHDTREQWRNDKKLEAEREETIDVAPNSVKKDFWCSDCQLDVLLFAHKSIESDWTNKTQRIACHIAQCPCGAILKRRITDSWSDPYYLDSDMLKKQRIEHYKDIIQPHETGYDMLYGK